MRRRARQPYIKKTMRQYFQHGISCLSITKMFLYWIFLGWKIRYFWTDGKLMEIWYLLITEKFLFWSFREWEIQPFLSQKSCWKDDIYWLLKSSCFNFFGNGKHGLFWVKKLMESWYSLTTEKFLFWCFRELGNRVFFETKSWWKDDIYRLLRNSCFELFGDGKYSLFSAKKLMKRWYILGLFELSMIFQDLGNMVFRAVCGVYLYDSLQKESLNKNLVNANSTFKKKWRCRASHNFKSSAATRKWAWLRNLMVWPVWPNGSVFV